MLTASTRTTTPPAECRAYPYRETARCAGRGRLLTSPSVVPPELVHRQPGGGRLLTQIGTCWITRRWGKVASMASPTQPEPRRCPACGSRDIRPSQRRLADEVVALLHLTPFRCRACGKRFRDHLNARGTAG